MPTARGTSSLAILYRLLARKPWLVWGISVALHGMLLGAVYEFVWRPRAMHPQIDFALGDGSAEGGMVRQWSIVAQTPALPASVSAEIGNGQRSGGRVSDVADANQSSDTATNFADGALPQLNVDKESAPPGFGIAAGSQSQAVKFADVKPPWKSNNQSGANSPSGQSAGESNENRGAAGNAASQSNGGQGPGIPTGALNRVLPAPVYPEESRRRREEGMVKLAVEILPDGSVGQITVISDPGYPRLVQAAVDSVRKARRLPVWQENGATVKWVAQIPFKFYLKK